MRFRKTGFALSAILLLVCILSLFMRGGPEFGLDFRGGTLLVIRFEEKIRTARPIDIDIGKIRSVFSEFDMGTSEIKRYGSDQAFAIRAGVDEKTDVTLDSIIERLSQEFPGHQVIEMLREIVGPKVGKDLFKAAVSAVFWAIFFILIYIVWRFELRFGIGAVIALIHDMVITLGIFSILGKEISIPVVAALLTIIGYSLNDTIVVYDRIREHLRPLKNQTFDYPGLINQSIDETIGRTIITSGTTMAVVLTLLIFGGEVINDFAFALFCGIITGTYSSIFIASPLLIEWESLKNLVKHHA